MADNVLGTRRTALALLGLQETPMVPGTTPSDSNPQKADGHIIDDHTRTLFPEWPAGSVVKVKDKTNPLPQLKNVLEFRCRPFTDSLLFIKQIIDNDAGGIIAGSVIGAVWNPNNWGNGDNKAYTAATIYYNVYLGQIDHDNDPNTPPVDAWDVVTYDLSWNTSGYLTVDNTTISFAQLSPSTTANAFVDQTLLGTDRTAYISYSSAITYASAFSAYGQTPSYPTVTHTFCARADADDPHGLKEYIEVSAADLDIEASDTGNGFFTYVLADSNTDGGNYTKHLCKGRWHYTPDPDLCGKCAFAGKTLTIEAKFKQATVTRTVEEFVDLGTSPLYQTLTLGTWSDHSTETFTLTLPDTMTAGDIGSEFTFPTSPGKVIVLDDLRLVSVT